MVKGGRPPPGAGFIVDGATEEEAIKCSYEAGKRSCPNGKVTHNICTILAHWDGNARPIVDKDGKIPHVTHVPFEGEKPLEATERKGNPFKGNTKPPKGNKCAKHAPKGDKAEAIPFKGTENELTVPLPAPKKQRPRQEGRSHRWERPLRLARHVLDGPRYSNGLTNR